MVSVFLFRSSNTSKNNYNELQEINAGFNIVIAS